MERFHFLIESNQRRPDRQTLLSGIAHRLADGHHHFSGFRFVEFALILQKSAHRIFLVGQIWKIVIINQSVWLFSLISEKIQQSWIWCKFIILKYLPKYPLKHCSSPRNTKSNFSKITVEHQLIGYKNWKHFRDLNKHVVSFRMILGYVHYICKKV